MDDVPARHNFSLDRRVKGKAALACERKEPTDERAECAVDAKEKDRENRRHDQHHDSGRRRFTRGWPNNLASFCPNLTDEFARTGLCHLHLPRIAMNARNMRRPADIWVATCPVVRPERMAEFSPVKQANTACPSPPHFAGKVGAAGY